MINVRLGGFYGKSSPLKYTGGQCQDSIGTAIAMAIKPKQNNQPKLVILFCSVFKLVGDKQLLKHPYGKHNGRHCGAHCKDCCNHSHFFLPVAL